MLVTYFDTTADTEISFWMHGRKDGRKDGPKDGLTDKRGRRNTYLDLDYFFKNLDLTNLIHIGFKWRSYLINDSQKNEYLIWSNQVGSA